MTPDLDALEKKARAATPGPWRTDAYSAYIWGPSSEMVADSQTGERQGAVARIRGVGGKLPIEQNMAFIAAANPAAILALIARVRAAEASAESHRNREWQAKAKALEVLARAQKAEAALSREEAAHSITIGQRDDAEQALTDAYETITGEQAHWSNHFGFADAIEAMAGVVESKEAALGEAREIIEKAEGATQDAYNWASADAQGQSASARGHQKSVTDFEAEARAWLSQNPAPATKNEGSV